MSLWGPAPAKLGPPISALFAQLGLTPDFASFSARRNQLYVLVPGFTALGPGPSEAGSTHLRSLRSARAHARLRFVLCAP
ncbi:MAG: hypothetical protein AAGJ19_04180 [Myxococcota bacterium]